MGSDCRPADIATTVMRTLQHPKDSQCHTQLCQFLCRRWHAAGPTSGCSSSASRRRLHCWRATVRRLQLQAPVCSDNAVREAIEGQVEGQRSMYDSGGRICQSTGGSAEDCPRNEDCHCRNKVLEPRPQFGLQVPVQTPGRCCCSAALAARRTAWQWQSRPSCAGCIRQRWRRRQRMMVTALETLSTTWSQPMKVHPSASRHHTTCHCDPDSVSIAAGLIIYGHIMPCQACHMYLLMIASSQRTVAITCI